MSDLNGINFNNYLNSNRMVSDFSEVAPKNHVDDKKQGILQPVAHSFTASEKNLAKAFCELLSGRKVPSEIEIIDPATDKPSPNLQKQLAKAAVKVATCLMTSTPGKESYFGFEVGNFTAELRRDIDGKFFLTVNDYTSDNEILESDLQDDEVKIDDVNNEFASRITEDVLKNPKIYEKGEFGSLAQLLVASDECRKSPLSRDLLMESLCILKGLNLQELKNIGTGVLRHWAALSVTDNHMTADSLRAEIKRLNETSPVLDLVNSPEAANDLQMIQELLEEDAQLVNSKSDISNIGQVRTDPQQGMSQEQKLVHNLVADLFMPQDSSVFDKNSGQAANRLKMILSQHPNAIKLLLENSYSQKDLPFGTIPEKVRVNIESSLNSLIRIVQGNYFNFCSEDEKERIGKSLSQKQAVTVDLENVKRAIAAIPFEAFESLEEGVNKASESMAIDQQKLITDKFTASLLKSDELKRKSADVPFWEVDPKAIINNIVKTPKVSEQQLKDDPEGAKALQDQRYNELLDAYIAITKAYREPLLAILQMKMDEDCSLALNGQNYRYIGNFFNGLNSLLFSNKSPAKWFCDKGRALFDQTILQMKGDSFKSYNNLENLETVLEKYSSELMVDGKSTGKTVLQSQMESFVNDEHLSKYSIDLKSPTLSQLDSEPDDFNKPGMGQLIRNVLTSYFSTEKKSPVMPDGISDELKILAEQLSKSKAAEPALPKNLSPQQAELVKRAIKGFRDAALYNENYAKFAGARLVDKRSMISSMIRYSDNNSTSAYQLGAMLKGAGPLMHKLLQGLELPGMDPDFKVALEDMKSNLNPIDSKYVQSQMLKLVDSSNGTIKGMSIKEPLGAASVGQAFLVTVTPSDNSVPPYEAVLKVIRPDVKTKTEREYQQFMLEAQMIPGMTDTYKGLYAQYQKEFDLTLEASNIKLGSRYYNDGIDTDRVSSMELVDGIPATETSMLVKQAPGTTLDRYIKNTKERIEQLVNTKFKTYDEYLELKKELKNLYQQMHDINKSLGVTAKKWINKSMFGKKGFFHGDMHPGNLMVSPGEPNVTNPADPKSKSKITIIDYGNATELTETQTKAVLKVNIACSFGGIYQFDASEGQKPNVKKHTLKLFLDGFKALLSPDEKQKFIAREQELVENVISPILLKGGKDEVGVRMSLLLKKLQVAGISIPGAIGNMAESEKRLSNGIDELNSMMQYISNSLEKMVFNNTKPTADPIGHLTVTSVLNESYIGNSTVNKYKALISYDLDANKNVIAEYSKYKNSNLQQNVSPEELKLFNQGKMEAEKNYNRYIDAEHTITHILKQVDDGFKYPLEEMWNNRVVDADLAYDDQVKKSVELSYGNYLRTPAESDELYNLHKQFLEVRAKVPAQKIEELRQLEQKLVSSSEFTFDELNEARDNIARLSEETPQLSEYTRLRKEIASIIKGRMLETLDKFAKEMPIGNPVKNDPVLSKTENLTSATIDVVAEKLSGDNIAETIAKSINFASDALGFNSFALTFNYDGQKEYFRTVAQKFIGNGQNEDDEADEDE